MLPSIAGVPPMSFTYSPHQTFRTSQTPYAKLLEKIERIRRGYDSASSAPFAIHG